MSKVQIIAVSCDPKTGERNCRPRTEIIDPITNELFRGCVTLTDFAERYMHFWNRLPTVQKEMVLVHSVRWVE
jgi:hypothetical protein